MSYPPPPGYPPPAPLPGTSKLIKRAVFATVVVALLMAGGVFAAIVENSPEPQVGDCLVSTEKHVYKALEIVDCDSSKANFKVINKTTRHGACRGREGTSIDHRSGRHDVVEWEICVVPV